LVRQQQQIAEKAAGGGQCPDAESCTGNHLFNCTPPESDGSPDESLCNSAGRIASCGGQEYCCPSAGGVWTLNMAACTVATPSPSPTVTPSPSPTATAAATATPGATATGAATATPAPTAASSAPTAQTTPLPIPDTGVNWPTMFGIGAGATAIIIAILLAL